MLITGTPQFFDVYGEFPNLPIGGLRLGHFREPFSMDALTSGNYLLVIGSKEWVDNNIESVKLMGYLFERPRAHLQLNLVVDPNRVGFNEIHFYVLDRTGRPVSELDSVEVQLSQPERDIGPIVREPFVAGPGHWQLDGNDLGVPGEWTIELVVGIDRFTEARTSVPVVVNP